MLFILDWNSFPRRFPNFTFNTQVTGHILCSAVTSNVDIFYTLGIHSHITPTTLTIH